MAGTGVQCYVRNQGSNCNPALNQKKGYIRVHGHPHLHTVRASYTPQPTPNYHPAPNKHLPPPLSKEHGDERQTNSPHHRLSKNGSVLIILIVARRVRVRILIVILLAVVVLAGLVLIGAGLGVILASHVEGVHDDDLETLDLISIRVKDLHADLVVGNLDNLASGLGADAVVDKLLGTWWGLGQGEVAVEAALLDDAGAARRSLGGAARGLLGLNILPLDLGKLGLEAVEIAEDGQGIARDVDETVVVGLHSVLVDNAAREGANHVRTVHGVDLAPGTGLDLVATVLAKEDRHGGVLETGNELVVARGLEGGVRAAPAVGVKGEEISAGHVILVVVTGALKVVPCVPKHIADISSRVSHWNLTLDVVLDVVLEVTCYSTEVLGGELCRLLTLNHLVGGEEEQGVGIVGESLNNSESAVEIANVVGGPGLYRGDGLTGKRRVDINHHVHTSLFTSQSAKAPIYTVYGITHIVEDTSALIVVDVRVKVVDTDGVDTENLHESGITLALLGVAEGIDAGLGVVASTASRLVGHTNDLELVAGVGIDELLALDLQGLDSGDGRGGQGAEGHESRLELISS